MTAEEQMAYLKSKQALMDAQDYLSQYKRLDARISLKLAQLDALREKQAILCRALGKSPDWQQPVPDIRDLEQEVLKDYGELLHLQREIGDHLRQVISPLQRYILEMRYLQAVPFHRLATDMSYEERQVYRMHRDGLRHVAAQLLQEGILPPKNEPAKTP